MRSCSKPFEPKTLLPSRWNLLLPALSCTPLPSLPSQATHTHTRKMFLHKPHSSHSPNPGFPNSPPRSSSPVFPPKHHHPRTHTPPNDNNHNIHYPHAYPYPSYPSVSSLSSYYPHSFSHSHHFYKDNMPPSPPTELIASQQTSNSNSSLDTHYTNDLRKVLGIRGLIPPVVESFGQQKERCKYILCLFVCLGGAMHRHCSCGVMCYRRRRWESSSPHCTTTTSSRANLIENGQKLT